VFFILGAWDYSYLYGTNICPATVVLNEAARMTLNQLLVEMDGFENNTGAPKERRHKKKKCFFWENNRETIGKP
jgi:hypothetical protein